MMEFNPISFKNFKGRTTLLERIKRYSMYQTMFFRTNVDLHTRRMEWIAVELLPYLSKSFNVDPDKLRLLCRVHDDPEIITGDHQLGRKLHTMSTKELELLREEENKAKEILASVWPEKINGYNYLDLLNESERKQTIESQVMKLIDRLDAFGESLHEIYSGNKCFLGHTELPKGVNPVQTYTEILSKTAMKYPLLRNVFDGRHPLLRIPKEIDPESIVERAELPDKESIVTDVGNSHYDIWKDITLRYGNKAGLKSLILKLE